MPNDTPETRILQEKRGHVLIITVNRPEVRNAFDLVSAQGMHAAMDRLDQEDDLFLGIITGAGDHFCAGADLKAVAANCVAIAATFTPPIKARLEKDPERLKKIMQSYVIRRPGEPEDVANMILYLSSDAASWITGQTYPVNGGYTFSL